jgi:hypothetical protein
MEKFDLFIANPAVIPKADGVAPNSGGIPSKDGRIDSEDGRIPPKADGDEPFDPDWLTKRGWVHLGYDLAAIKKIFLRARQLKANAYIVPVSYRHPAISKEIARKTAMGIYEEMKKAGHRLEELSPGTDDLLWWTFYADDQEAIEKDLYPGRISISLDKNDGHVRTKEEYREWLNLSSTE